MGISLTAYARHRGVTPPAVSRAIKDGRIFPEADGTLDPEKADSEWDANTKGVRIGTKHRAIPKPQHEVSAESPDSESLTTDAAVSIAEARRRHELVKSEIGKVKLAELQAILIDRDKAETQVFKLARELRDAWLNWPASIAPQIASELSVDAHELQTALEAGVRSHLQELGEIRMQIGT